MSGEAARILNAGKAMKPQPVNKLPTAAFRAFDILLAPVRKAIVIWSSSQLSRFPMLAIGKASDQAAVSVAFLCSE